MKYAKAIQKPQRIVHEGEETILQIDAWTELDDALADSIAPHTNVEVVAEKPRPKVEPAKTEVKRDEPESSTDTRRSRTSRRDRTETSE